MARSPRSTVNVPGLWKKRIAAVAKAKTEREKFKVGETDVVNTFIANWLPKMEAESKAETL